MSQGQRRLAAIMFTDMVGYTALGQRNESLSLALVEEQRRIVRPILARHYGKEVKTIGDAFLVVFSSAADAVRCAYDIQRAVREFNLAQDAEKRIHLRIGVHVGEVVESMGDISGDAVNVASRIEPLAEDGGVCLTRQVYDQVKNKVDIPLTSLGSKLLKNVLEPMEVYRMDMPWGQREEGKGELSMRRVAILPFASLSPDPSDEYFADGLTEELIDRLCQVKGLEVIARTSAMSYKKKDAKAAQIGRELRAGGLVEGSVRKAGNKIRVTAQLIDANTEGHLWSSRYDRDLEDIFSVQTEIAEQVVGALQVQLLPGEKVAMKQKRTENMEAYTLYLKGRQLWNLRTKESVDEALQCFERASEVDQNFALAYVGIADCYLVMENFGSVPSEELAPKANQAVIQALKLDENLAEAHASYGIALASYEWKWQEAEQEFRRAIELKPSYATAHHWYARSLLRYMRRIEEDGIESDRALELDPLAPMMSLNKSQWLYWQERWVEGLEWCHSVLQRHPGFVSARGSEAYGLLMLGRYEECFRATEEWLPKTGLTENRRKLVWVLINGRAGRETEARRLLGEVVSASDPSIPPSDFVYPHLAVGEADKMFEALELALRRRDSGLPWVLSDPLTKAYWSDPRFVQIKRKVGLISTQ